MIIYELTRCNIGPCINHPKELFCLKSFHLRENRNYVEFITKLLCSIFGKTWKHETVCVSFMIYFLNTGRLKWLNIIEYQCCTFPLQANDHTSQKNNLPLPLLTSSRREYYFFRSPRTGLFSVKSRKKILAINNFFVNEMKSRQPNKCLIHWHFEN